MRVISGIAGGRRLEAPKGDETVRPTTDRVKEALFSIINFDLPAANVLDLFSGSGQLGIEALSRGAKAAIFVDSDYTSCELTKKNLNTCNLSDSAKVHRADCIAFLHGCREQFDIAFVDPPYYLNLYEKVLPLVSAKISDGGIITCEHPSDVAVPSLEGFKQKDYKYGKIVVTVFRKEVI